ncbi:MAG: CBS domain-containing protein [Bacteroidales bacterium]|nr:CBS domain-containing protein [Bacteroidales bacterium]
MNLKELIDENIPILKPSDKPFEALSIMDINQVKILPIVNNENEYLGLISEEDLNEISTESKSIKNYIKYNINQYTYLTENQHIFDVLSKMSSSKLPLLAVINNTTKKYLGVITETTLINYMANFTSSNMVGGIIEIITDIKNYSPALITTIVENNELKVMGLFTNIKGNEIEVTIKLNGPDTSSVVSGLERYGYRIKNIINGDHKYSDLLEERYNSLINYLNV